MRRLRSQDGFTMIEVLMAVFVLSVGIIGLMGAFDGARKLTLVAEQRASAAHRAQWEIEKLTAQPYDELAMFSAPSHSTEVNSPDHYVNYNSPVKCTSEGVGCYVANAEKTSEEETLVYGGGKECKSTAEPEKEVCGLVSGSPTGRSCSLNPIGSCEWKDGTVSGYVYDFVTWHSDVVCEKVAKTCSTKSYKRLTVVSTVNVPANSAAHPQIRVSTLISDPTAVPEGSVINGEQNPLTKPETTCGVDKESCVPGVQKGNPQSWYLHDAPAASGSPSAAPSANHTTHATVAPGGTCTQANTSGCPAPDLMDEAAPTATKLFLYSTDQGETGYSGGRILKTDRECGEEPTATDNTKGELWVSPALGEETTLTGYGGLSIFTQTTNGAAATVTLCVAVYDVPASIANLVNEKPKEIGASSYKPATWPTTMTELSFQFQYDTGAYKVASGHRIGFRIWPSTSSTGSIAVAYDVTGSTEEVEGKTVEKAGYGSLVQLNTE